MSTLRVLRELEKQTFLQCRSLQSIPEDKNLRKNKTMFKVIGQQNILKDKNKFYEGLKSSLEKIYEKNN